VEKLSPVSEKVSLIDRTQEKRAMRLLLKAAKDGFSGSLVLRGEPGIGKTALLEYAVAQASGMQVARLTAVESEMEVGFAALHQLLTPFLPGMDVLPAPQREALRSAFGMKTAEAGPPDRFLVGLATLTLLASLASQQPLLVAVDDGQWMDQSSAEVLAFVARRVHADSIALLFAVREPAGRRLPLDGLSELRLTGLSERGARALLATVIEGPLDDDTAAWLIAGANGNPLALIELPGELREGRLDGRPRLPEQFPVGALLRQRFLRQVEALPAEARTVLLLAAAEPSGDPALLWRAAKTLGLTPDAAATAEAERLLTVLPRVSFRHPLIRSAVYYGASDSQRRQAHQALAAASDPELDPQRRSWHLAAAALGPDERVAAELERSAERAAKRGGYVATAAFLARAAEMTPDRGRQAARRLAAAQADLDAGNPAQAMTLLERAAPALGSPFERAMAERLYGGLSVALGQGRGTVQILLESARTLLPLDSRLGRDTLLEAMEAAIFFQRDGGTQEAAEVGRTVPALAPADGGQAAADLLLDGLAVRFTDGYEAAVPYLRRAIKALRASTDIRWCGLGCLVAAELWDLSAWHELASHWTALARQRGALTPLQVAMQLLAGAEQMLGRLDVCQALIAEAAEIAAATGNPGLIGTDTRGYDVMAALRGQEAETRERVAAREREGLERGGGGGDMGAYALTMLEIGLGRHHEALPHALRMYHDDHLFLGALALPEVVEAAARSGEREAAVAALDRLTLRARASGTPWALGLLARSEAVMAADGDVEERYRDAFAHLGKSLAMPDLARARLLYGERLRQQGRRAEARHELRTARDMFSSMELAGFARRAQAGLGALGVRLGVRRQSPGSATGEALTAQEERIARLVAEGASNSEAGAALFLSPNTIDYHLRKVFRKLGITSRTQLVRALRDAGLSELGT
jgi:DNA-binding CsgD family transcriptional regulator